MGANISATSQQAVQESVKKVLTNVLSENLSYTTATINAAQVQKNDFSGAVINCKVNNTQDINVTAKIYQTLSAERTNALVNDLKTDLEAAFSAQLEQENKKFNIFQANASIMEGRVHNLDYTTIATTIANKTQAVVNNEINANQSQENYYKNIVCDGPFGTIENVQNINITNIIDNIVDSREVNDLTNAVASEITADLTFDTKQSNVGFDLGMLGFIFLGIVCLVILGVIIWAARKGSDVFKSKKSKSSFGGNKRHHRRSGNTRGWTLFGSPTSF